MITLEKLKQEYEYSDHTLTEITDKQYAKEMQASKSSSTWSGGKIEDTGWTQLASPSETTFVCKTSLLD